MAKDEPYREAEKKIEAARRSGATELDLSASGEKAPKLTELPESLGQLTQLQSLDLSHNQLTALPGSLGQLTQLQSLNLAHNELTSLPAWLGQLTQLQTLGLSHNQVTALPESLGQLTQLRELNLTANRLSTLPQSLGLLTSLRSFSVERNVLAQLPEVFENLRHLRSLVLGWNQFKDLPDSICKLSRLEWLFLTSNPLSRLPDCIRQLKQLNTIWAGGCNLNSLPDWIGELALIDDLQVANNQLVDLPVQVGDLARLATLELDDNPLNPELAAAYKEGLDAVKRYLRELAKGARKRYEAKLLILGDGNEGKTCVSRALRGLPFAEQVTTRGVDVEQWKFEHPDYPDEPEKEIALNIWDFEGQEINHQTHQFFLTTQALYLLVFKCRDQFLLDRAEYWLDTIRARAPNAKVAIVITQCEARTPYVPQDKLRANYGDLLVEGSWLFAVGCADANNSGISGLKQCLQRWAADLEFMGREWPKSYSQAETAIKQKAQDGAAHISRTDLDNIFRGCEIDPSIFKDLAGSMSALGVMTQFPECPDLSDFVVLQPQWLTKAISEIMEDKQLADDQGEISLERMRRVWDAKGYQGMFAAFHTCMKEFELCYDLEDANRNCLVPLRFGYEKPAIPWTLTNGDVKTRRVEYKLGMRPPTGIMSRFIVKTHHMIVKETVEHPKGVYWHNGVFLRTGEGQLTSEALCEFDSDLRTLRLEVRAAFPQNLLEQIHGYVKAVFSFFRGLEAERSYGCIKVEGNNIHEERCEGAHSESRIYSAIRRQRVLDCEHEFHDIDPQKLIWGISTFGEYVREKVISIDALRAELDKKPKWAEPLMQNIDKLLGWVDESRDSLDQLMLDQASLLPEVRQQLELKLHEYLAYTSDMLDDRDFKSAPGIISVSAKEGSKWNPASYFKQTYLLTPFCESVGNIHPCEDGRVEFTKDRDWWEKTAPWIARGTKVLAAGLQLAFAGMPLAVTAQTSAAIKDHVKFMDALTKHLELKIDDHKTPGAEETFQPDFGDDLRGRDKESRLRRAALSRFLEETAPNNYRARQWGSLQRVRMSDNSYRWLCETHTRSKP